jgi:hypothetical protein
VRRARFAPWSGEQELDFDAAELVQARVERGEPVRLAFQVRTPEGAPLAVEGKLGGWHAGSPPHDEDPSPDGVAFSVPRGAR